MATTPRGITLMDDQSIVNPLRTPFNKMANEFDAALDDAVAEAVAQAAAQMPLILEGSTSITGNGTTFNSKAVVFPEQFASAPTVIVGGEQGGSTTNTAIMVGKAQNITTNGFTLQLKANVNYSATYSLPWIAVGKRRP